MPSGVNQCNTTIIDDDGFYDCSSPLIGVVVGDEAGYLPLKPLKERFEPFVVTTARILSDIKVPHDEVAILLSGIKLSFEEKVNLSADIKRLYEYYGNIKSKIKYPFEESAGLKSLVKLSFEETAWLESSVKYPFEENAELISDIKYAFEEVAKLQPDLSLEEFSEWVKDLINDRKLVEIGKINKEIDILDGQIIALQNDKLKTGEISRLKDQISRLEDEKKRIKKKLKIKKILRVLKALDEI